MKELNKLDLNRIVGYIPTELADLMRSDFFRNKIFIAGGFIRAIIAGEKINDIDVFVDNVDNAQVAANILKGKNELIKTDNAFTIKTRIPIQIIHRWNFNKPEDVINSFDYTISKSLVYFNDLAERAIGWVGLCDDHFYEDLATKRLIYTKPIRNEDAGGSMIRVLKYYEKGYRIPLHSLSAVLARMTVWIDMDAIKSHNFSEESFDTAFKAVLYEIDPQVINVNIDE